MKGNTINQFIDDLLTMGGPEKEFLYKGKRYMLESEFRPDINKIEIYIFECFGEENYIFRCFGNNFSDCVEQLEKAKIFDNSTLYEAEKYIEVIFG